MRSARLRCLIFLGAMAVQRLAVASTATSAFQVTATVGATCTLTSTNLAFGGYSGSQLAATSTLSVVCTLSTPYNVGLSAGISTGATVSSRAMTGSTSAALLHYGLYADAAHTVNWGNTVGTDTLAGVGTGTAQALTIYGMIPASQGVPADSYADTVTATITY